MIMCHSIIISFIHFINIFEEACSKTGFPLLVCVLGSSPSTVTVILDKSPHRYQVCSFDTVRLNPTEDPGLILSCCSQFLFANKAGFHSRQSNSV